DPARVNQALDGIDAALEGFATRLAARGFTERRISYRVDAHYGAQVWDLPIELPCRRFRSDADAEALFEAFHQNHLRVFSVDDRASPIEFIGWTGRVSIRLPQAAAGPDAVDTAAQTTQAGTRSALFDLDDRRDTRIYRGDAIRAGDPIEGPAIIEEATTTLVLPPGTRATLTPHGSYVATLDL
ncbi:MAG: hypothetical protein AB7K73_16560, partial [Gammaproteobacteria bacterium]